ncbi:MAG: YitT family protein [Bacilli bacterium]|nr:YitT family protein [Bacilli bacterium]
MKKARPIRKIGWLEQYVFLTLGVFIMAVAFYFFVIPSGIVTGGVTGIAMVFNRYFDQIPISVYVFVLSILFLFSALVFLGKREFYRSIYGSFLFPAILWIFEMTVPNPDFSPNDLLLVALYAGGLIGIGFAIVIHYGGTTGGTDIPIKIMKKYTILSLAVSVYIVDSSVILLGALTSPEGLGVGFVNALYALVIVFLSGKVADSFLLGLQSKKAVHIITQKPEIVKEAIFSSFSRGMTEIEAYGAYTDTAKTLLVIVIQNSEYLFVRNIIIQADPQAFVYVTPASEIHGEWSTKEEVYLHRAKNRETEKKTESL